MVRKKYLFIYLFLLLQFFINSVSISAQTQSLQENSSAIEKIFYNEDSANESQKLPGKQLNPAYSMQLKQFGYDIFDRGIFLSGNSKISKDYRFNTGDRIDVFFWGDSIDLIAITGNEFLKSSNELAVDKEGNIFIPGVGLIHAKGKTSSGIENDITRILGAKLDKINTKVTLADSGSFPIMITGQVKYKGNVYLNSRSNIIDALSLAGGVLKTGSLREIIYINRKNNSKLTLDLYDTLLNGNLKNIKFDEGDIIFIKPIGKVAALGEGVKVPGIYEFRNNETLKQLINYGGGLLPSINPKNVQIQSFDNIKNQRQLKDIQYSNLWNLKPNDGDIITFNNIYNSPENLVYLEGNVKHPCSFQYKNGMKLTDVLKNKDDMLVQTFADQAVIERISGIDRKILYIPVSLSDFFNGDINPELQPLDKIKIYPSTTAETVEISGYITNPGLIPYQEGLTLKKLLGHVRFGNSSCIEFVSNKNNEIRTKNLVAEIITSNSDLQINTIITETSEEKDLDSENQVQPEEAGKNIPTKIVYLYDLVVKNDAKADVSVKSGDKIIFRNLQANETVETVGVFGYVNSPGVFKYSKGMKLKDAIKNANGLEENAYLKGLVLLRPSIAENQRKNTEDSLVKIQEEIALKVNMIQSLNNKSNEEVKGFMDSQKDLLEIVKEKAQKDYAQKNYGRLTIEINTNNPEELDDLSNVELKPGDEIYIPYRSEYVAVMGEVLNNTAVSYIPRMPARYYINKVGGFTEQSKKRKAYIVKANGSVKKLKNPDKVILEPGDTVFVPKKIGVPINWLEIAKSFAQIAGNVLSSVYILTKI